VEDDDDGRGEVARQAGDELPERLDASRRRADDDDVAADLLARRSAGGVVRGDGSAQRKISSRGCCRVACLETV